MTVAPSAAPVASELDGIGAVLICAEQPPVRFSEHSAKFYGGFDDEAARQMVETIRQTLPVAGFPAVTNAFAVAQGRVDPGNSGLRRPDD